MTECRSIAKALAALGASLLLGLPGPSRGQVAEGAWLEIDPPAVAGSRSPALATEAATTAAKGHDLLLIWLEPAAGGERLRFSRFTDGAWGEPITVAEGSSLREASDPPSLTVIDTQGVRRTLIARVGDMVARSGDAGRTWTRLPAPDLAYASFAGADEGAYAFWVEPEADGAARLLGTRVLAGGEVLDEKVGSGAGTAAAMTWDGPVVIYRDEGGQDLAIVRREEARWTRPRSVSSELAPRGLGRHPGGPRVAAERRRLAVAWFTEIPYRPRLLLSFSEDAGRSFGPEIEVDAKRGRRAPEDAFDLALEAFPESGEEAGAWVVWRARDGRAGAELRLARVFADGRAAAVQMPARGSELNPDPPRIVRAGEGIAVAWGEAASEGSRIRARSIPLAALTSSSQGEDTSVHAEAAEAQAGPDPEGVGRRIAGIELHTLEGKPADLASLRGEAILLNLWATWCLPCIAEMPVLEALWTRYREQGLRVVGLSIDEEKNLEAVRTFVAEKRLSFPIWLDPEMVLYEKLWARGLPVSLVIDRKGRVLWQRDGVLSVEDPEFEAALGQALARP